MKSLQRWVIRIVLLPLAACCAIIGLIIIWQLHGRSGDELIASLLNAGFFLVLGLMIQSLSSFRSPHRVFRRVFRQTPHTGSRRDSFYVVIPHFTSRETGVNGGRAESESRFFNSTIRARRRAEGEGKFFNPSISVRHKVTLDVVVAGNDAESAGALGSGIVKMTQGYHSPEFRTDAGVVELDRPAVLFGLYSNSWVRSYWDYVKREHGVLKPHAGQAGFWARSSDSAYKRILPLDKDGNEIDDFWKPDAPVIDRDYTVLCRVRGNRRSSAVWIICTSIGPTGTRDVVKYLTGDGYLEEIFRDFKDDDEFILVFEVSVTNKHNIREVHCWPLDRRHVVDRVTRLSVDLEDLPNAD